MHRLEENVGGEAVSLSMQDLAGIRLMGERYPAALQARVGK